MAEDTKQPLPRTQALANAILAKARLSGSSAEIEIAEHAIAIFCRCCVKWCEKRVEDCKRTDTKEMPPTVRDLLSDIKTAIATEIQEVAANRILDDLGSEMGSDFESELGESSSSCASAARWRDTGALLAFIDSRAQLDESMQTLQAEMVGACADITDELTNSDEFTMDLLEWGIVVQSTDA